MTAPLLSVDAVTHRFGRRTVLDAVGLDADAGEVVAVIGPNGAGKSTLLAAIAGDLRPDAGEVRLMGRPVGDWGGAPPRRGPGGPHPAVVGGVPVHGTADRRDGVHRLERPG